MVSIQRLSSRHRLVPATLVCAVLLVYFLWFNAYTVIADAGRHSVTQSQPPTPPAPASTPAPPSSSSSSSSSTSLSPSPILLVSAFYPLQKSKHTHDEYRTWLAQFLGNIDTDIYFFTMPALEPLVRAARANLTHSPHTLTINTTYASPLDISPLAPHAVKYTQMHAWDRERARHGPDLYAVWNAKPWFLTEGLRHSHRTYKYAFWTDAGSFRHTHAYRAWPDPARVDAIWARAHARVHAEHPPSFATSPSITASDLVFFPTFDVPAWSPALATWTLPAGPVDLDISEGSFFGGAPPALVWYARAFYAYHDYYISARPVASTSGHPHGPAMKSESEEGEYTPGARPPFHFVGKDQTLINALFMLHPQRFFTVVAPMRAALLPPSTLAPAAPFPPPSTYTPAPKPGPKPAPAPAPPPDAPSALTRLRIAGARKVWAKLRGPAGGVCGDEWFYYQFWVAGRGERGRMRAVWGAGREGGPGLGWGWGLGWVEGVLRGWEDGESGEGEEGKEGKGQGCGVMPVVTVEGVLRGVLGKGWEVPAGLEDVKTVRR